MEEPLNPKMTSEFPEVSVELERQTIVLESSQIYVHCHYRNGGEESGIRIWKSTYIIDRASGVKGSLLHAENISYAPDWTWLKPYSNYQFLLIFEGLPAGCVQFDLVEDIGEPNGFFVSGIRRNTSDVYHVQL